MVWFGGRVRVVEGAYCGLGGGGARKCTLCTHVGILPATLHGNTLGALSQIIIHCKNNTYKWGTPDNVS